MLTSGAPHQQMGHPGQYPGQAEGQPGPQQAVYGKKSSGQSDLMKVTAQSTTISVSGFSSVVHPALVLFVSQLSRSSTTQAPSITPSPPPPPQEVNPHPSTQHPAQDTTR